MSVFAARRGASGPLTIVVVNKANTSIAAPLALRHFAHGTQAAVYQYAGGSVSRVRSASLTSGGFRYTYPARSVSMVVVPPAR